MEHEPKEPKAKPDMMAATKGLAKSEPAKHDGKDGKKKKKKVHMHIRPIEDGLYHVENTPDPDEMKDGMMRKTEHAKDLAGLHKHIDQFYGEQAEAEPQAQPAPSPAPVPAPSPAPAQPMPMGR